jgi:hypothetical protein
MVILLVFLVFLTLVIKVFPGILESGFRLVNRFHRLGSTLYENFGLNNSIYYKSN